MKFIEYAISITLLLLVIVIIFLGILAIPSDDIEFNENTTYLTYKKCCGGHFCTDTYYNEKKDLCVLTLCQQSFFTNKQDCYYPPNE